MRFAFAISSVLLGIAAPALAEPPTGSRLGDRAIQGLQYTEEQADEAGTRLASCMAAKRERFARDYMAAKTAAQLDKAQGPLFRQLSCLGYSNLSDMSDTSIVSMPPDILRGKIAEAFLKDERDKIAALAALPLARDYARSWFAATGRDPVIDEMGACVADTNPRGVGAVLSTRGYSKEEGAAFGALSPSLGPCLRVGAKLQANRPALRAALADALYQRLHGPAPVASQEAAK